MHVAIWCNQSAAFKLLFIRGADTEIMDEVDKDWPPDTSVILTVWLGYRESAKRWWDEGVDLNKYSSHPAVTTQCSIIEISHSKGTEIYSWTFLTGARRGRKKKGRVHCTWRVGKGTLMLLPHCLTDAASARQTWSNRCIQNKHLDVLRERLHPSQVELAYVGGRNLAPGQSPGNIIGSAQPGQTESGSYGELS